MQNQEHKKQNEIGRHNMDFDLPPFDIAEAIRFNYFKNIFRKIKHLEGDVVECGVGKGRSLLYLSYLVRIEDKNRNLWGFDSFEGFPEPGDEDKSYRNVQKGEWTSDILGVYRLLEKSELDKVFIRNQVTLIKGYFEDSLTNYRGDKIALLHADADLYKSYKDIYEHLFDKVVPGGIIMFDEYLNTFEKLKFPGAQQAIDEFFAPHVTLHRDTLSGKFYGVKNIQ